jgi:hypothetical protein
MPVQKRLVRKRKRVDKNKMPRAVAVAWYKPEQWERLKKISRDCDELENTFTEWIEFAEEKVIQLEAMGLKLEKVEVDVDEMLAWCNKRSLPVDGESRSMFASYKLNKQPKDKR